MKAQDYLSGVYLDKAKFTKQEVIKLMEGYNNYKEEYSKQLAEKQANEAKEFIKYCKEERNTFVRKFWEICGENIQARVMAEDLLIAYDQLVKRISVSKHESIKEFSDSQVELHPEFTKILNNIIPKHSKSNSKHEDKIENLNKCTCEKCTGIELDSLYDFEMDGEG